MCLIKRGFKGFIRRLITKTNVRKVMDNVQHECASKNEQKGGRGQYCCIPDCGSSRYDKHKIKTKIGLFKFPIKNKSLMRSWKKTVKNVRRKGGKDKFSISSTTVICEYHFKPGEVKISIGSGRKSLVVGAVPSKKLVLILIYLLSWEEESN